MRSSRKIRIGFHSITRRLNPKENLMKKFSTAVLLSVSLTGFLPLHAAWQMRLINIKYAPVTPCGISPLFFYITHGAGLRYGSQTKA
jgi:hypothetical protein